MVRICALKMKARLAGVVGGPVLTLSGRTGGRALKHEPCCCSTNTNEVAPNALTAVYTTPATTSRMSSALSGALSFLKHTPGDLRLEKCPLPPEAFEWSSLIPRIELLVRCLLIPAVNK